MQKYHQTVRSHVKHEFTVYDRTWGTSKDPPTKWRAPNPFPGYTVEGKADGVSVGDLHPHYTGIVYHVIMDEDDRMFIGQSKCSKVDTFTRSIGRAIARGRAEKAMHLFMNRPEGKLISPDYLADLTIVTTTGKEIQGLTLV